MVKVLIAEDNAMICIHLSNVISVTKEVGEINIVNDGTMVYPRIKELKPEIVVLDLKLPGEDGISILEKIQADSELQETNVIIYSGEPAYMERVRDFNCVKAFYQKTQPTQSIGVEVKRIAETMHSKKIEKDIYKLLGKLGFSLSHKGTKFLKECIQISIEDNEENLNAMYEKVSRGKVQSGNTVKADVQRAIKKMWKYANREKIRRVLRLAEDEIPTPKNVVPMIKYYIEK